ncbi:PREDICTED: uncharacterized protein LOC109219025 [Nicotiana attenuata]|uniref:uncharacterized protein LOC109219025 n=1 Tax=Nicotiana attenuata TaxID=49451 RepID=UPI000905571B|nr:PREDICTED: uncharacterized protein LOC109219025 [Nicotiana attenuata]
MAEDSELWDVICDGPFVPMKTIGEGITTVTKTRTEYKDVDRKAVKKNFKAKKILVCGIDQMNTTASQPVKQSKIDLLTTEYELFKMKEDESIQYMYTRFTPSSMIFTPLEMSYPETSWSKNTRCVTWFLGE